MRRNGDRGLVGGDREILDRGYGFHRTGDRWLPDRWLGMPGQGITTPPVTEVILTTWPDSSGRGHTATGIGSPILVQSVLNGFPVVRFRSASHDGFNIAAITMIRPSCIVAVMKRAAVNKIIYALAGNGASGIPIHLIDADGGAYASNANGEYAHWPPPLTPAVDLSLWHVINFHDSDAAYPELFFDGTVIPFVSAGGGGGNKWLNIAYNAIQSVFSDGDIAELAIYNGVNRTTDVLGGEAYFGNKYGITQAASYAQVRPNQSTFITAWWSASALWVPPNLADGAAVSQWPDSSGNGNHATGTGSTRPIVKTNVIGGKPVVRYAATKTLNLTTPISAVRPWTAFVVMKPTTPESSLHSLLAGGGAPSTVGLLYFPPYQLSAVNDFASCYINTATPDYSSAWHVITTDAQLSDMPMWIDGTFHATTPMGGGAPSFNALGLGDGDIAEVIFYSGDVALRAKLMLLITTLLVTGQFPGTEELERMVGHRERIKRYLHRHGAHPTREQLDAVVTPMAAGDRAGVEAYLAVKYGIPVAGGTPIDPAKVAGLQGWWKADSLIAPSTAFDPSQIAGLKAWFKADAIVPLVNGTRVVSWPDSSASGNNATNATITSGGGPIYYANQLRAVKDALRHADQGINTLEDDFIINSLPENIREEDIPGQMLVNKPAVLYDGLAGMTLATPIATGGTVICVLQNNIYYSLQGMVSSDGLLACALRSPSGPDYAYNRMLSNGTTASWGDQTLTAQQWYVVTNDTTGAIRINGAAYPVPYGGLQAGGGPFTSIGSVVGNGGTDRGWVAEVLYYDHVLSDTDRQQVEAYLKAKYGL